MYKNLTWFTACDLPAARKSLSLVMIIVPFLSKTSSVDTCRAQMLDRKGGLLELSSLQPVAKKQRNKELLPLTTLGELKLVAE